MVAPITGPFNESGPDGPYADFARSRYRQAAPFDLPLTYSFWRTYGLRSDTTPSGHVNVKQNTFDPYTQSVANQLFAAANNLAYERLRSQLGSSSGWAENIAQINKTRVSVVERSVQLGRVATAIRKCDFVTAARVMRTPKPSGVSNRKAAAQNFLEWEYGWKPLFHDLVNSLDSLTSFPEIKIPIKGSAKEVFRDLFVENSSGYDYNMRSTTQTNSEYTVRMGAVATVSNPNLFLANQLGVIDFALPWKLIPFSFVVDWFVNVEQCISSISDWYGVTLQHQWTTRFARGRKVNYIRNTFWTPPDNNPYNWLYRDFDQNGVHIVRTPAISGPVLTMKPFKGFSIERGAQAISLVLSVLGK